MQYPISITQRPSESHLSEWLAAQNYSKIFVLTDSNTVTHCYPTIAELLPSHTNITIPAGEVYKNIDTCCTIWQQLTQHNADRKALLINLGGGVIGDMGGFCAATYKRGIDFIQIPTTLLSQADASVGGKLGIDFSHYKNQIGVFAEPKAVFVIADMLFTLPERELFSGFAEVIKHALISDKNLWQTLKTSFATQQQILEIRKNPALIATAIDIKKQVVTEDPYEKGKRKILNYGHTIGHAIESWCLEKEISLLHGEAVAWGIVAENYVAVQKGILSEQIAQEIESFLSNIYQKPSIAAVYFDEIANLALQDKKNEKQHIQASLITHIGHCEYNVIISLEEIKAALHYLWKK